MDEAQGSRVRVNDLLIAPHRYSRANQRTQTKCEPLHWEWVGRFRNAAVLEPQRRKTDSYNKRIKGAHDIGRRWSLGNAPVWIHLAQTASPRRELANAFVIRTWRLSYP